LKENKFLFTKCLKSDTRKPVFSPRKPPFSPDIIVCLPFKGPNALTLLRSEKMIPRKYVASKTLLTAFFFCSLAESISTSPGLSPGVKALPLGYMKIFLDITLMRESKPKTCVLECPQNHGNL